MFPDLFSSASLYRTEDWEELSAEIDPQVLKKIKKELIGSTGLPAEVFGLDEEDLSDESIDDKYIE